MSGVASITGKRLLAPLPKFCGIPFSNDSFLPPKVSAKYKQWRWQLELWGGPDKLIIARVLFGHRVIAESQPRPKDKAIEWLHNWKDRYIDGMAAQGVE